MHKNESWIARADDSDRAGFDWKQVESVPVVDFSRLDVPPGGDVPPSVEVCVRFEATDLLSDLCSWKERQTETDGGGVEDINRLCQPPLVNVSTVQVSGFAYQIRGNPHLDGPVIMLHATSEILVGNEPHHLSKDRTTSIYSPRPFHKENSQAKNPHRFPSKTIIAEGRYRSWRPLQKLSQYSMWEAIPMQRME